MPHVIDFSGQTGAEGKTGPPGPEGKAGTGVPAGGAANEVVTWKEAGIGKWSLLVNANVKAAAAIEESKLSTPEMVKLKNTQIITGKKKFRPASGVPGEVEARIVLYDNEGLETAATNINFVEALGVLGFMTLTSENPTIRGYDVSGEITFTKSGFLMQLFRNSSILKAGNEAATTLTLEPTITIQARPQPEPGLGKTTGWNFIGLNAEPLCKGAGETATGENIGLRVGLETASKWTFSAYRGLLVKDPTGEGVVTTSVGLDVEDLKKATTNYSLRSVGTAVKMLHEGPVELGSTLKTKGLTTTIGGLTVEGALTLPAESVKAPAALIATTPAPEEVEGKVVVGTAGVARKVTAVIFAKVAELEYKIKHGLGTRAVQVSVEAGGKSKLPKESLTFSKFVVEGTSEIKIAFAAVVAGEEYYVTVVG